MKHKNPKKNKWIIYLIILYIAVVTIRYLLALATSSFPTVGIDEFLYYSLGRSIATEGTLLFRGQSADYAYLLYPLTLSPVYLLFPNGVNFYRLLQLWNILLMSASVFPLFFLSRELIGSEKKSLAATALSVLLPDFIIGQLIFSEAVIYPLFFTLMYCACQYIKKNRVSGILWAGFLGGLLYSVKPGAIASAAVFLAAVILLAVLRKRAKDVLFVLVSVLIMLATASFFWILARFVFRYEGSLFSIYDSQLDGTRERSFGLFLKALVLYPFYFLLACGIVGVVYPVVSWKKWELGVKTFWWIVIAALAVMIVGSAWAVEQVTTLNNLHLRYVAMYIPLFLLFCFVPYEPEKKPERKQKKQPVQRTSAIAAWIVIGYVAVCVIAFGSKAKAQATGVHAMISLSLLNDQVVPLSKHLISDIAILLLCAASVYLFLQRSKIKHLGTICIAVMSVFMIVNGVVGYKLTRDAAFYPKYQQDGKQVRMFTQDEPYIYLLSAEGVADMGVDVNTKQNNCIVFTNDFFNHLMQNDGIYSPFVPETMRGMRSVRETPDVDTLVVDYDSYPYMKLSPYASAQTPYERGNIYVVHFTKGKRVVDSTLSNLTNKILEPGKPGIILCYDEEQFGSPVRIHLEIESGVSQTLTINSTTELYSVELSQGRAWYDISFKRAEEAYNFFAADSAIRVLSYKVSFAD